MKIVAVVPMKLNNQRLPGKNVKPFSNGEPLCTYILNTLCSSRLIDEVYVYCSDEAICKFLPRKVRYLKRSEEFDANATKMNGILKAFVEEVDADIYIMTHATAPFVKRESIEVGINMVLSGVYDSAFAVKKMQDFLWKDGKPFNYRLDDIPRTQDLEPLYIETSVFFIYDKNVILEQGRRIGNRPYMVEVSEIEAIDIDEEEDFTMADAIYNYCWGGIDLTLLIAQKPTKGRAA